jgi:hypothetical protein
VTHAHAKDGGLRGASGIAVVAVLLLVAGMITACAGLRGTESPAPAGASDHSAAGVDPRPTGNSTGSHRQNGPAHKHSAEPDRPDFGRVLSGSEPAGLAIPSIGLHVTTVEQLQLAEDGAIEVPKNPSAAGWFAPGPSPGQLGPAVIAGHVDSTSGPAVFYRLSEVRSGDLITVDREDDSQAVFEVQKVASFEKDAFPTRQVYGLTDRPAPRLITCGGIYDDEDGYLSNTVVFATLVQ